MVATQLTLAQVIFSDSYHLLRFPSGSDGKETAWNAGDWSSITGLGRFLKKEMATHRSIFAYKTPWMEEPRAATVHEITKSWTRLIN